MKALLIEMQVMVCMPLALSSLDFLTNNREVWERVGGEGPRTTKRMAFLFLVRSEMVMVWSSPSESR